MSDSPVKPASRRVAKPVPAPVDVSPASAVETIAEIVADTDQAAAAAPQPPASAGGANGVPDAAATPVGSAPHQSTPPVAPTASIEEVKMATNPNIAADTAGKAQAFFADANEKTKSAFEKGSRLFSDAGEFGKGNVEALVESGRIAAKGLETIGRDAADYGRRSFESASSQMKTLAAAKSPTEFVQLQSDYLRGAFDAFVAEASKSTEAMLKLAGEVVQPLSSRASVAVEKIKTVA